MGLSFFYGFLLNKIGFCGLLIYFLFHIFYYVFFFSCEDFYIFMVILDNVSIYLIILSFLVGILMCMASFYYSQYFNMFSSFYLLIYSLIIFLVLVFSVSSFFIFYLIFEFIIIPTFFLIISWGYNIDRFSSGMYMFLYTLISSMPFLFYLLKFYKINLSVSFCISYFYFNQMIGGIWWILISIVFLVKLPVYLVHLWLPKAHVDAPLSGSMILAGVLLKLGGYGLIKIFMMSFYDFYYKIPYFFSLSLVGSILVSFFCLRQIDMKSLVAYSSVVHMGPVLMGIFSNSFISFMGSFFMMLAHGICSSCMFFMLNSSYERFKTRSVLLMRGGLILSPVLSYWWFFISVSNMSCPPTFNFIAEVSILLGFMSFSYSVMLFMGLLLFLSGIYSIYFFTFFNHGNCFKNNYFYSLMVVENLIFFIHSFILLFSLFFIFMF